MKKIGLGIIGPSEGHSSIFPGLDNELWNINLLCGLGEKLGKECYREFGLDNLITSFDKLIVNPEAEIELIKTSFTLGSLVGFQRDPRRLRHGVADNAFLGPPARPCCFAPLLCQSFAARGTNHHERIFRRWHACLHTMIHNIFSVKMICHMNVN